MPRRKSTGLASDLDDEPQVCTRQACRFEMSLRSLPEGSLIIEERTEAWVGEILTITEDHTCRMKHDPQASIFIGCANEDGSAVTNILGVFEKSEKAGQNDTKQQAELAPPSSESPYVRSGKFDEWISELLEHTMSNKNFAGGADDIGSEGSSLRCPVCAELLGDPLIQHLQRCIYAHEEKERLRSTIQHFKEEQ